MIPELLHLAKHLKAKYIYVTLFTYEALKEYMSDIYANTDYADGVVLVDHSVVSDSVNYILSKTELPLTLITQITDETTN